MVVLKTIQAQGRRGTLSSRVMFGILIVQDLAVVPLMIVLPELSDSAGGFVTIGAAALRATLLLGVIVLVATRLVPRLMAFVARWNSRELFLLSTTTLALASGTSPGHSACRWRSAHSSPVSSINESEYAHQALSDIVPLAGSVRHVVLRVGRDAARPCARVAAAGRRSCSSSSAIVVGKAAILAGVVRAFGYWNVVPLAVGLTLFQVGEFAFVLARVGLASGAIPNDVYTLTLNAAIVTMVLTPAVSGLTPVLYERLWPRRPREAFEASIFPFGAVRPRARRGLGPRRPERRVTRCRICSCRMSLSSPTTAGYSRPASPVFR